MLDVFSFSWLLVTMESSLADVAKTLWEIVSNLFIIDERSNSSVGVEFLFECEQSVGVSSEILSKISFSFSSKWWVSWVALVEAVEPTDLRGFVGFWRQIPQTKRTCESGEFNFVCSAESIAKHFK